MLRWRLGHGNTHRTTLKQGSLSRFGASAFALLWLCAVVSACGGASLPAGEGVIVDVSDGDTITVSLGGREGKVRLIGVDTPETVHPTKPVGCYGPEASAFTKAQLPKGTKVKLVRDVEARDYYDRLLAYVYRSADNVFINLELVRLGFGTPLNIEPNSAYRQAFVDAAFDAREANRGLWQACHR